MKSRRSILIILVLLAVAGGLAWVWWPTSTFAPEAKSMAAKPAAIPTTLKPIPTAKVEAPQAAPAKPGNAQPTAPETDSSNPDAASYSGNTNKSDPIRTNLGEVAITDGMPVVGVLVSGETFAMTPKIIYGSKGDAQIQLAFVITDNTGKKTSTPKLTVMDGTSTRISMASDNNKPGHSFSIELTPYVAGQPPPSTWSREGRP